MSSTTTSSVATGALSRITVEEFRHSQLEASFRHGGTQSAGDMGVLLVLKHLSFVVPFDARARIFQRLIADDSAARVRQTIDPAFGLSRGGNVFVTIRREHMYQDAFDQLSALGPSLRSRVRVQMTNEHGLNEAGIDGGGLFREFLTDIIKQGMLLLHQYPGEVISKWCRSQNTKQTIYVNFLKITPPICARCYRCMCPRLTWCRALLREACVPPLSQCVSFRLSRLIISVRGCDFAQL